VSEQTDTLAPRFFGQRVKRLEDPRFLLGKARYVDDIVRPGMLFASFVRASEAHARIIDVDLSAALEQPGVIDGLTGAMISETSHPIRSDSTMPTWQGTGFPALAIGKVRFVGEAVACVVAEDRYAVEDAAEAVIVEYDSLPALATMDLATAPDAPLIHEDWADNHFIKRHFATEGFGEALEASPRRARHRFVMARHTGMPMENRACIAEWDGATLTLWTATQIPHLVRTGIADALQMPENRVRVIAPDVGGGFGIKGHLFPEELACCIMAIRTGRPVKWVEDRREHMISSIHAREHTHEIEVGYDDDGTVMALKAHIQVDCGAYSVYPWTSTMDTGMAIGILPGPYRIRNYHVDAESVATNKTPLGPYRGVARPAACFSIERTIDAIAEDLELDPAEVRRRNLVREDEFPYTSVTGLQYDSGSFIESLDMALEKAGYDRWRAEQADAREHGRYLGIGVVTYTEQTAHTTTEFKKRGIPMVFGFETSTMRIDPSGQVTVHVSIHSHGQGLETTLAQITADNLGIPMEDVRISFGDTSEVAYGSGTFASRSAVLCGGSTSLAAQELQAKLTRIAAHLLEAAPEDIEITDGHAHVAGTPSRGYTVAEIARMTYHNPHHIPEDEAPLLESTKTYDAAPGTGTFANSALVAKVEVDPDTGFVTVRELVCVEDCGKIINPLIVDGQVHGGLAQGIGSALFEELVYDADGQPLTTTFLDYLMPGTTDMPSIEVHHIETPSPFTVHGIKGMGEGGAIGPGALIAAAVDDAIRPLTSARVTSLPITPEKVLALIEAGKTTADRRV
jgi:aerobic carbon-monoxide dehydrogenase large subunit